MNEQELDKKIQQGIETYMRNKQFNYSKIPAHEHNGTDTIRVNEKDLNLNSKMAPFMVLDTSETFKITNLIPNMNHILFRGFAANNADGSPATERMIINGEIYLGNCYSFSGTGSTISATGAVRVPFIQCSNSMFIDSATLANNRVSATNQYFIYGTDETGSVMVVVTVDTVTSNSITLTATLASNWKLQGSLIIS